MARVRVWLSGPARFAAVAIIGALAFLGPGLSNGYLFMTVDTSRHLSLEYLNVFSPPFYNVWLYPLWGWKAPWAVALAQAGLAVGLVWAALRTISAEVSAAVFAGVLLTLGLLTYLPFASALALPDALTAAGILALGLAPFQRTGGRVGLALVAWLAAVCHYSHLLIYAGTLAAALLAHLWLKPEGGYQLKRFREATLALVLAFTAQVAQNYWNHGRATYSIAGATFALASFQQAGPATDYLKQRCAEADLRLCGALGDLPMNHSEFLWNGDGPVSRLGGPVALSGEAREIVLGALLEYPRRMAAFAAKQTVDQLTAIVGYPIRAQADMPFLMDTLERGHPEIYDGLRRSKQFTTNYWEQPFWRPAHELGRQATAFYLPVLLVFAWLRGNRRALAVVVPLMGGVLANAAVCGTISWVYDRYQSRVQWLLALSALLLAAALFYSRSEESPPAPRVKAKTVR